MENNVLKGLVVLALLSGCSSATTASTTNNNTLQANPTKDTQATEETVVTELPIADDFTYTEYKYESYGSTIFVASFTNTSDATIRMDVNAVAYDASNNIIGASDDTNACIGAGEQSYIKFYFSDVTGIDHVDYKSGMAIKQDDRFVPVISNLDVQGNVNGDVITYSVVNNGDIAAEFVQIVSIYLDSNNTVLDLDESYVTDSDSEIKAGATQVEQVNYYNRDGLSFNHVDYFVKGRGTKQ